MLVGALQVLGVSRGLSSKRIDEPPEEGPEQVVVLVLADVSLLQSLPADFAQVLGVLRVCRRPDLLQDGGVLDGYFLGHEPGRDPLYLLLIVTASQARYQF